MNKQELLEQLQDIEWDNFEVKEAAKELPKSSWETVSAFANTFIRTGSGDQRASEFEINALYLDQSFGTMSGKTVENNTENDTENNTENDTEKLTNNQKTTRKQPENIGYLILEMIKSNSKISRSEMVKQLNITEGSLRYHLEQLKTAGIIRREGADKGGKWVIINNKK